MRAKILLLMASFCATSFARGQGTMFYYDQQSATNVTGGGGAPIQPDQPIGQSFTPSLSGVDFVQFQFHYSFPTNGLGATVYVNLRQDSITGTVLSATAPVTMPPLFSYALTNFFFPATVSVTPGTQYYFQPVVLSGDSRWEIINDILGYPGGTMYVLGAPQIDGADLWFREGEFVPEPSSGLLALLGCTVLVYIRRKLICSNT